MFIKSMHLYGIYGVYEKVFRICVYCCWEILRFVSDSVFFLVHSLVNFFWFVEAVKKGREKEKERDIYKLDFYFGDSRILWGDNDFLNQQK